MNHLRRARSGAKLESIKRIDETITITFQIFSTLKCFLSLFIEVNYTEPDTKYCILLCMYVSRRRYQGNNIKQRLVVYLLIGTIGLILCGFIFFLGVFAWYSKDLPSPGKLSQKTDSSTVFYDRDGKVLYEMYKDRNRVPVNFDEISDYIKKGTVAVEDKDFFHHSGISERGIIRAFLVRGTQGGSTITQQLIKNVLLDSQRTASRKIKEIILAIEVERRYKKDEILTMYLNEAPYGGSFWGVESAARGYFGKQAKDLNLVESAFLAGLPQSPSYYSPFIGKNNAWKGRTKDVLRRMREDKYITFAQEQQALQDLEKLQFTSPKLAITAPHFVFYVKDQLEREFGNKILDQGLRIKTTLSLDAQLAAEKIVKDQIENLKGLQVGNGAVVVLDSQTGEILAMVGSYDFNNEEYGKFNVAVQGNRQPGSSIKPITYAVAFEKGYTPATVLMDVKTTFPNQGEKDYEPVNYDGKFRGPVQLRFALGNSLNIPSVKILAMVGVHDFLAKADEVGLHNFAPTIDNMKKYGLAITLGGGESTLLDMTSAFSTFARGGIRKDVQGINEVTDFNGKIIYKSVKPHERKVFSPEVSFLISNILSDNYARVDAFGPNSYLRVAGKTVAVKTGTTDDKRDNWAIGFTKSVTVGAWVGNNDNTPMNPKIASGVTGASPIWHDLMVELLKKYSDGIMDKPEKVKQMKIDAYAGGSPKDGSPTRDEYFIEGTEPKALSPVYKKVKISKANGKLANDLEIRQGNYEEKDFTVFSEDDPVSSDGKNRWQEGINTWLKDHQDNKSFPPTETSSASSDSIFCSIKSPSDNATVGSSVDIKAKIISGPAIKHLEVFINGNKIRSFDDNRTEINESTKLDDGVYEVKIFARNEKDNTCDSTIKIGVNKPWDSPTPTPTP